MRRLLLLLSFVALVLASKAQIGITVSGNTNTTPSLATTYTSLASCLAAVNGITAMSGPVTITMAASSSETAPATGLILGSASLNPVLSATNTITIVKASGTVTLNAGTGTATPVSAIPDGMLVLNGADYITIDGLTLTDGNSASATVAMEFGIGLFKRAAGDGCNNNTIKNCTFNMQRINNTTGTAPMLAGSVSILLINSISTTATTALTPTNGGTLATNGTNSNNKFYSNTINGGNIGIGFSGYAATSGVGAAPTATTFLGDLNNDIGGAGVTGATTGNSILNYGGGAASNLAAGIYANNQWGLNISNNTINNNNGSGVNHATTLYGIYGVAGTSANATYSYNTVTINGGGTSSTIYAISNSIGSTASANTVNMNYNNVTNCTYTTLTSGTFYAMYNSASAANVNMNNNTVSGLTLSSAVATGTIYGLYNTGTVTVLLSMNSNTIQNLTSLNTTGTIYITSNSTSTPNANIQNNIFNNITRASTATSGSLYVHYNLSSPTGVQNYTGNTITNITSTATSGTGSFYGLYDASNASSTWNVYNNTVSNITSGSGTSYGLYIGYGNVTSYGNNINNIVTSGTIYGLYIGSSVTTGGSVYSNTINTLTSTGAASTIYGLYTAATNPTIYKNRIYDIQQNGATGVVYGIYTAGGTTVTIYNNIIGDLRTPTSSLTAPAPSIAGLYISSGTTVNAYFNTISLSASSSGTNFGSTAVYVSATPTTANLRNNIFVNNSTPNGTGKAIAFQKSSTSYTNYAATSNNNLFYAGSASSSNLIFYDGTNSDQAISTFKIRVSPRDAGSVTENPSFLSLASGSPSYLHINPSSPTQVESAAIPISGITDDFDGDARNASTPDIGADEGNFTISDLTGPSISFTNLGNGSNSTSRTTSNFATITDASSVNVTPGTAPRLYYKKSTDPNDVSGWRYVESTSPSSPFDFLIDYSQIGGVNPGDIINYFVVAQDNVTTPNVGINGGSFTTPATSVDLTGPEYPIIGTLKSYTIVANAFSGDINVGGTETITSLTNTGGLFDILNTSAVVTGNLTVHLTSNLSAETGTVALSQFVEEGVGNYTITIKPDAAYTISGTSATSLLKFNGADRLIIDGSTNGGTDKSLTITNASTGTSATVLWFYSASASNPATSNTIKNCIISGNASTTTGYGIVFSGSASVTTAAAAANSNNTIQSNQLSKVQIAVSLLGTSGSTLDAGNVVSFNNVGTATEALGLVGIQAQYQNGVVINRNDIQNVSTATTTNVRGISLVETKNAVVSGNKIHKLSYTSTSTTKIFALNTSSGTNFGAVTNPSANLFVSNAIYDINSTCVSTTWNTSGINDDGGYGDKFYNNSVHLIAAAVNNYASAGYPSAAFSNGNASVTTSASALDIRNNIFSITGAAGYASSTFYGNYIYTGTYSASTLDNNDIYVSLTSGIGAIGYMSSTTSATLAAWKTATSKEASSISLNPLFTSTTDLHINAGTTPTLLESKGAALGITTDFDGDARPGPAGSVNGGGTASDIGADEFDGVPVIDNDIQATAFISPTNGGSVGAGANFTPQASFTNGGGQAQSSITVRYRILNAGNTEVYNQTATIASLGIGGTVTVSFPTALVSPAGAYTIIAKAELVGDQATANDQITGSITAKAPLNGTYFVGASQIAPNYTSLTNAVNDLNALGVSGIVNFKLKNDYSSTGETFPLVINAVTGSSTTNKVTISPDAGVTATVSGSSTSAIFKLNGASNIIIDGSNSGGTDRSLTITNTNASGTAAIWLSSLGTGLGAANNTIKNCNIATGSSTVTTYGISVSGTSVGTAGADNDNVTIRNNAITVASVGIYANGTAAVSAGGLDNLVIAGNSVTYNGTTTSTVYGIEVGNALTSSISQNTIDVQTSVSGQPVGISLETGFVSSTITQNKITRVATSATGGYGGRGITIGTGTATSSLTVANNIIYGVNGSNYTGFTNSSSMGITIGGVGNSTTLTTTTGGVDLYYNSINLYGNHSYSSATVTAALYIGSAVTALNIKDNVFANSLINTTTAGSKNYAVYSVAANTAFTSINNNDYYVPTSGNSTGIIGFLTSDQATLAAWKTATAQDANSIAADPLFNSSTNLVPGVGSPAIAAGTAIAGITTDINGVTRSASAPTMGAYENAGDAVPPTITYTPLSNTTVGVNQTLTVTVTDASGVPTSGTGLPRLYYKLNAGAYTAVTGTSIGSNQYTFTFGSVTTTVGDVISYYVVAQDLATTPNVGASPSVGATGFTANPPTAGTPPTTPNTYTTLAPISGIKTVGTGGNYATLTGAGGAFAAINGSVLNGNIDLQIISDLTTGEDGSVGLNQWGETGGSGYTVKIYPTGTARLISGSSAAGLIKLNGADRVTINGSIGGTGTDKSLSITNTNTGSSAAVIWLASASASDGATNNTIKNTIIYGNASTTTGYGIALAGTSAVTANALTANSSNTVQNNQITKVQIAVNVLGTSATTLDAGNVVSFNALGTANEALGLFGVQVIYQNGLTVNQNDIQNISSAGSTNIKGIAIVESKSAAVTANKIHGIAYTGGSTTKIFALNTSSGANFGTVGNPSANLFANNAIYDITSNCTSTTWNTSGINDDGGYGDKFYFNSVNLIANTMSSSTSSGYPCAVFSNGNASVLTSASALDIRNNIFSISGAAGYASSTFYGNYMYTGTYSASTLDNNDLYVSLTTGTAYIGYMSATSATSLAAWKTATSKEASSIAANPLFNGPTNLIPSTGSPVANAGTPIAGITTDIIGTTRNATTPVIGAYEVFVDGLAPNISYVPLNNTTVGLNQTLTATITDGTGVPTSGAGLPTLYYKLNTGAYTPVTGTSIGSNQYTFTFGSATTTVGDVISYYIVAQDLVATPNVGAFPSAGAAGFTANPPAAATPPTAPSTFTALAPLSGIKTVGTGGNYATLTGAGGAFAAINASVLAGNIDLQIISDLTTGEDGSVALNQWGETGGSGYTVKIYPTGAARVISGSKASDALIKLNGADRVTIDGSIGGAGTDKSLSITNTNTTAPTVISMVSLGAGIGATNNTVKNCVISVTANTPTSGYGIAIGGTIPGSSGADNDNVTVQNNTINNPIVGVYAVGTANTSTGGLDNLSISSNTITTSTSNTSVSSSSLFNGIQAGNALTSLITLNTISVEDTYTSSSVTPVGISLETGFINSSVTKNIITKVATAGTGGYGGRGITVGTGTATSALTIANNIVYGIGGSGYSGFSNSSMMGIAIGMIGGSSTATTTAGGINLYNNSVNLAGSFTGYASSATVTAAIYIGSGATSIDLRNNILVNTLNNTDATYGSSSKSYAMYSVAANTAFTNIDNNDYYVSGTQSVLSYITADRTTLAALRTNFGSNTLSISTNPSFTSATNLLPTTGNDLIGANIATVTTDIAGTTRLNPPAMGAYEVSLPGIWTATAPSNVWENSGNWRDGAVPASGITVYVPAASTNMPALASSPTLRRLLNNGTLTITGTNTVNISSDLVNVGTLTGTTSGIVLNGTAAQAAILTGNINIKDFTLNNTAGATLSGAGKLNVTGTANVTTGVLASGGVLTLKSLNETATGTGRITALAAGAITGNVTVERFILGSGSGFPTSGNSKRGFRFMGHPLASTIGLSQINAAGGISISGAGGATNGFQVTGTNNASAFWYDPTVAGAGANTTVGAGANAAADAGWQAFTKTDGLTTNAWPVGRGIRFLFRGDQTQSLLTNTDYTMNSATVKFTGAINIGPVTTNLASSATNVAGFNVLGNPLPSPVDLSLTTARTNMNANFYVFDPSIGTRGGYSAAKPFTTSYILPVGGGFVASVATLGTAASITFPEASKAAAQTDMLLRNANQDSYLKFRLEGANMFWDELNFTFGDSYKAETEYEDGAKLINSDVNFYSITKDDNRLSLDYRKLVEGEVIPLGLVTNQARPFTIKATDVKVDAGTTLYLVDRYLHTQTKLETGAIYDFVTTSDAASQGESRFEIGLKQTPVLPVIVPSFTVTLSPNPAKDMVKVTFTNVAQANTNIAITNAEGKTVKTVDAGNVQSGQVSISLKGLAKGNYFVTLNNGTERRTEKLIIIE